MGQFSKDEYAMLVATRNLEINLFWQRANYFLALTSALAFGFFNLKESSYGWVFTVLGIVVSWLWFQVCLGGKYWQTRWEQRLMDYEKELCPDLAFFAASRDRVAEDVRKGIEFHPAAGLKGVIYRYMQKRKPSVSYSMIRLSLVFFVIWLGLLLLQVWGVFGPVPA